MIYFFLVFLSLSEIPKYSVIFVSSKNPKELRNFVDELNEDSDHACETYFVQYYKRSSCKSLYKPLQQAIYSSGSDINDKIKKVSKYGEFLFIILDEVYETIDLNKLKSNNVVFISYDNNMYNRYLYVDDYNYNFMSNTIRAIQKMTNTVIDEKAQVFTNLCNKLIDENKIENPKISNDLLEISIVGDIKKKVSFLSVSNAILNVEKNNLNVHSLYMYNSKIASYSKSIRTTFFVADYTCSLGSSFDKIKVEQIGFQMFDYTYSWHELFFFSNQWCVTSQYDDLEEGYCYRIPYNCAKTFNWIVRGHKLYIIPESTDFGPSTVNITIVNDMQRSSLLFNEEVRIIPYGKWSDCTYKPKITVTYDSRVNYITYENDARQMFSITEAKPYSYIPINKEPMDQKVIGIACGVAFIVILTIIFIIIAVCYRPKKVLSEEEELNKV